MDHLIRHHIAFSAQDILHRSSTAIRPYIVLPASMAFADLQAPPFLRRSWMPILVSRQVLIFLSFCFFDLKFWEYIVFPLFSPEKNSCFARWAGQGKLECPTRACIGPPYSGLGPLVAPVLWARRWKCLGISKTQERFRPKPKKIGSTKNIQKPTYRTSCLERAARKKGQCGNHPPHSKLLERAFGGKQGGEPLAVRFVAQVAGKALPNHSNWTAE